MKVVDKNSVFPISREHRNLVVFLTLAAILVLTLLLRLWGLEARSLSHPEIYIPGINLVPNISEPPPRLSFAETVWWHFHDEPHPMGWYAAMLGWTTTFGTSHFALRFPGVLFALGSIPLIFLIARSVFGSTVACLAALLLALHGFHIAWSQTARMYVAGAFLSLMATWLLLCLVRARTPKPGIEMAYITSVLAGILTVEFFWPLIAIHLSWAALVLPRSQVQPKHVSQRNVRWQIPRLFQVQALAFILSAPALTHAVYRARHAATRDPNPEFFVEYFSFGFLFAKDHRIIPMLQIGPVWTWLVLIFALVLLVASLKAPKREAPIASTSPNIPAWVSGLAAVCSAGFMLWLASIAHRRNEMLIAISVLPFLALLIPVLGTAWRSFVPRLPSKTLHHLQERALLLWLLAVAAPLILFVASYKVYVLADRAFLVFVPYLLILCAAGAVWVFRNNWLRLVSVGLCVSVFVASVFYASRKPGAPNDYQGIAQEMQDEMQQNDLVFLRYRNWVDTPLLYYISDANLVASEYEAALQANPDARVWLVTWTVSGKQATPDARHDALKGYERTFVIEKLRARAELFEP